MKSKKITIITRTEILKRLSCILEPWISDIDLLDIISEQANLITDLGLDSVGILQVVLGIEKEFDILLENNELDSQVFSVMTNLVNLIEEKINEDN